MKVLFDHNVPHKLRLSLAEHSVSTADEMGWDELENGELLSAAEASGFFLMVTCDKNLAYQQNLTGRALAVVVLSTNDWNVLKHHPQRVMEAVNIAKPGSFQYVTFPKRPTRP